MTISMNFNSYTGASSMTMDSEWTSRSTSLALVGKVSLLEVLSLYSINLYFYIFLIPNIYITRYSSTNI